MHSLCSVPWTGVGPLNTAGTLWTSHLSSFLDVRLELNATVTPSFCAMNYLLAESEKTKADGSYWDNSARKKKATSTNRHISPCDCRFSPRSYSLCCLSLPFSRGNQWEAVTLCGQRHYSDDSLSPIKNTKKIQAPLS